MEKQIAGVTYWLGIISAAVAIILRANATFGWTARLFSSHGNPVGSYSFLHAAILFFVASIATAGMSSMKRQN
ncbi:MAG: hypothetical protein WAK91_15870 [Candidatus Acidiferrales bacterium]|jgi:hypothetical protein